MKALFSASIDGPPHSQGRPRASRRGGFARVHEAGKDRLWKAVAMRALREALGSRDPFAGGLRLEVVFRFDLPRSRWRKKPRPWSWHEAARFDLDNLLKALMDAGTGILWHDDGQIADVAAQKIIGAQGQAPGTFLTLYALDDDLSLAPGAIPGILSPEGRSDPS